MASAAVVAGLLAGWGLAALVLGLVVGRVVWIRERQRPDATPRLAADVLATGRAVSPRADLLGD